MMAKYWSFHRNEDLPSAAVGYAMKAEQDQPLTDGDGTVPLISMGLMCRHPQGWHGSHLNPSGIRIVSREYLHEQSRFLGDIRYRPMRSCHASM